MDGPIDLELVDDEAWILASDSAELLRMDLASHEEVGAVPAGSLPTVLAVGSEGQALIGDLGGPNGEYLLLVDVASSHSNAIELGDAVGAIAPTGSNTIWVLEKSGRLDEIDLHGLSGEFAYAAQVPVDSNEHIEVVSHPLDGSAWGAGDTHPVTRVNFVRAQHDATIDVGGGIPFDVDADLVWGARPDEIWALDPATNAVSRRVPLENLIEILAMDIADGEAWVAARRPGRVGTILRIDLASGEVTGEWPASLPASIKLDSDAAWAVDYETDELIRIPR